MYQCVRLILSDIDVTNRLTIAVWRILSRQQLNCLRYYHVVGAMFRLNIGYYHFFSSFSFIFVFSPAHCNKYAQLIVLGMRRLQINMQLPHILMRYLFGSHDFVTQKKDSILFVFCASGSKLHFLCIFFFAVDAIDSILFKIHRSNKRKGTQIFFPKHKFVNKM